MISRERRYVVTIALFAAATAALILAGVSRRSNRISYEVPRLGPVSPEDVDRIVIDRADAVVTIGRTAGGWTVSPGDYPADAPTADYLPRAITGLQITDVVSVGDDPAKFDLGADSRVRVTLASSGVAKRVVDIGKRAATFGHTYVSIPGDGRILQAAGELRALFDRDLDDFRDKQVFSFDPKSVTELVVRLIPADRESSEVRLVRTNGRWAHAGAPGQAVDQSAVDGVVGFLSNLSAYRYRYGGDAPEHPWLTVRVVADRTFTLDLFSADDSLYPARASTTEYVFSLFLFQASLITEPLGLR